MSAARIASGLLALLIPLQPAAAGVVGGAVTLGAGAFRALTPPIAEARPANTVGADTMESDDLFAFNEDQNIRIDGEIRVDIGRAPQAGDIVASHYVFFDPGPGRYQEGYVDFDAPIFGVATSTRTLRASDFLASSGVTYLNPGLRGLEIYYDRVWIDPDDPFRLRVAWSASSPGDYVRVFTGESPLALAAPRPAGR